MSKFLIAVTLTLFSVFATASEGAERKPETKEVCYDKDSKPVKKGTKGAICKKIRVHKMFDGVKIPPAKK